MKREDGSMERLKNENTENEIKVSFTEVKGAT